MNPIRVLVVEDSLTVREQIVEALQGDAGFHVVGQAADGAAALRLCERQRPDVISMDMVLPGVSGLEATRRIMSSWATPILVVSASSNRGDAFSTLDALKAGAVEVFEKSRIGREPSWREELKAALRLVSRIKVVTRPRLRSSNSPPPRPELEHAAPASGPRVVLLGASTGGPAAVARILSGQPASFPLPTLVVIHVASLFAEHLAGWFARATSRPVRIANDGDALPPAGSPEVILAPPDRHLVVEGNALRLTSDPERHSCRPSVDVLFESAARSLGPHAIACLLTGMGRDGARGLLALRRAGAVTIAQDEGSSVVFGMPREAIELGAARQVLSLDQIAAHLSSLARPGQGSEV